MAIWITGDTHGGIDMHKLSSRELKSRGIEISEGDYLIILGDFGFPFLDREVKHPRGEYHYWMKWFREKKYTVLWIDGNHDNFNFWEKQPFTERFGGRVQVHPEAENVLHLMRGEIYEIEGKTFFTFGGALSVDKARRQPNISWWEQEEATPEQMKYAEKNLAARDFKVDYILTHTLPRTVISEVPGLYYIKDKTADFLDEILLMADYKMWLCGHMHLDILAKDRRLAIFYQRVARLEDIEAELAEEPVGGG